MLSERFLIFLKKTLGTQKKFYSMLLNLTLVIHLTSSFVLSLGLAFDMLLSEQVLSSYNLGILFMPF